MLDHTLLTQLAEQARPQSDLDWGSDRQINAENKFFAVLDVLYPEVFTLEYYSREIKCTSDERIDNALKVLQGLSQTP